MADQPTLFSLPNSPDDFAVLLPAADLRRMRFSAFDFQVIQRATIEYIKTFYPDNFNDFVASNGIMMLTEVLSAILSKLSLRADLNNGEAFITSCNTELALVNHLALINQRIQRQTPATVDVQLTIDNPVVADINLDPGFTLVARSSDAQPITYQIYRAPGDFSSKITIPAGKRGVIAYGIEGAFASPVTIVSSGGKNQTATVNDPNMLEAPIFISVATGDTSADWQAIYQPIEGFGPTDQVVEVNFLGDNVTFRFGDDSHGKSLMPGQVVTINYRTGGGVRGRVGVGQLTATVQASPVPPATSPVTVTVINVNSSVGGTDKESFQHAKQRAPRNYATHESIVTAGDYAVKSSTFSHPVFGAVAKAVATVRTGQNANLVEVYVLAFGADGSLVIPNLGLKQALATYLDDLNVLTDTVKILDGQAYLIDIDATIVVGQNADASVVKTKVEAIITSFFDVSNWEMGEPLYISNLIEAIESVPGVSYVNLYSPSDNILPKQVLDPTVPGIAFNELITEGSRSTKYYYDKGRFQGNHQTSVQ